MFLQFKIMMISILVVLILAVFLMVWFYLKLRKRLPQQVLSYLAEARKERLLLAQMEVLPNLIALCQRMYFGKKIKWGIVNNDDRRWKGDSLLWSIEKSTNGYLEIGMAQGDSITPLFRFYPSAGIKGNHYGSMLIISIKDWESLNFTIIRLLRLKQEVFDGQSNYYLEDSRETIDIRKRKEKRKD